MHMQFADGCTLPQAQDLPTGVKYIVPPSTTLGRTGTTYLGMLTCDRSSGYFGDVGLVCNTDGGVAELEILDMLQKTVSSCPCGMWIASK